MSNDFEEFDGIGPTTNERLHDNGYETYADLADADSDTLSDIQGITEDRALSAIAQAENAMADSPDDSEASESDSEDDEEEAVEEVSDDDETAESVESEPSPDVDSEGDDENEPEPPYEVSLDLTEQRQEIFTAALMDSFTSLKDRNRSRSMACERVIEKYRDTDTAELSVDEMNALYSALREKRTEYKGNNHIELMQKAGELEDSINEVREDVLY